MAIIFLILVTSPLTEGSFPLPTQLDHGRQSSAAIDGRSLQPDVGLALTHPELERAQQTSLDRDSSVLLVSVRTFRDRAVSGNHSTNPGGGGAPVRRA